MVDFRSKKGNYILEASIVLPVIIFTTITVVLIIMFFYSQMTERSMMHVAMRKESGSLSGTTDYLYEVSWDGEIYGQTNVLGGEVYGKKYIVMEHRGTLSSKGIATVEGTCYWINPVKYIRSLNHVGGAVTGE